MGRTYRYDPDCDAAEPCAPSPRRGRKTRREGTPEPEANNVAWAVGKMESHVSFIVEKLVSDGLIEESDREEYAAVFNAAVCEAWTQYDPNRKGEKSGRTASPVHFMTMKVDSKLANVMDYLAYRRWTLDFKIITDNKDAANSDCGFIWSGDVRLSDSRRWREFIELRMDVQTLLEMLTAEERMTLLMRLDGYTDIDIAEALVLAFRRPCDRHRVQKVHAVHIQEKARRCGFFPHCEAGMEKTENSFSLFAPLI